MPGAPFCANNPDVSTLRLSFTTGNVAKIEKEGGVGGLEIKLEPLKKTKVGISQKIVMSITLPGHDFPYWSDPSTDHAPPALIIGAGLSAPMVPLPSWLARDYAGKQDQIEQTLDINTGFVFTDKADDLYCWAGCCIAKLMKMDGATHDGAKQRLVSAMGLLEDARFAANASVPLRGTTPRHRVLARLAREGRIHSMWSLNWDLWLEAAFEAVGMIRSNLIPTGGAMGLPRNWKKAYQVWLPPDTPTPNEYSVTLYKPHGCIRALYEGTNSTFRITDEELKEDAPAPVKAQLQNQLNAKPVCAMGWGATEKNLQDIFTTCANAHALSGGGLTVVSLKWNDGVETTDSRHSKLAENFGQDESNTLCGVKKDGPGTTDDLMQWIQALRSLRRFHTVLRNFEPEAQDFLELLSSQIQLLSQPVFSDDLHGWPLSWFDTFFPVWSRLCFTSKALVFLNDGNVPPDALSLVPRDAHIPLNDTNANRWDILSGAHLYCALLNSAAVAQKELDFESYPGAFWHETTRTLLVPIPMWADVADISFIALKPLVESRHWAGMGRVDRVCMLRVRGGPQNQDDATSDFRIAAWKQRFCSLMRLSIFANPEKIDCEEAVDLPAYLQRRKDEV